MQNIVQQPRQSSSRGSSFPIKGCLEEKAPDPPRKHKRRVSHPEVEYGNAWKCSNILTTMGICWKILYSSILYLLPT